MKRIALLLLSIGLLLLTGCSKELVSLEDTKWTGAETGAVYTLVFTPNEFILAEDVSRIVITGDYVYESPNITLVAKVLLYPDGSAVKGGGVFKGKVEGKKLTLTVKETSITMIKK